MKFTKSRTQNVTVFAREEPVRYGKTQWQKAAVTSLWFSCLLATSDVCCDRSKHNKHY